MSGSYKNREDDYVPLEVVVRKDLLVYPKLNALFRRDSFTSYIMEGLLLRLGIELMTPD